MTTNDTSTPHGGIEHRIGAEGKLAVKVANWDIDIVAVEGETATVAGFGGQPLPDGIEIDRGDDRLAIRQPATFAGLGVRVHAGQSNARLVIEVPTRTTTVIQSASGDVRVTGLSGRQAIRTASGDVVLDAVAGELSTETVSGGVRIRVDGSVAPTIKSVSGDVILDQGRAENVTVQTTSGDVRLTSELGDGPHSIVTVSGDAILATLRGIRVTAQTLTGDLRSDLPHTSDGRAGRRSLVVGDGAIDVTFRSVSGDLRVVEPRPVELGAVPTPPAPPAPPAVPALPNVAAPDASGPAVSTDDEPGLDGDDERLDILRALERGEIDIDEATERLATLDGSSDG